MTILADIAAVLETTEANAMNRVYGLRLAPACGRCGGCGQYSFNGSHSRCYGCNGAGQRKPRCEEMASVLVAAEACKSDGRLAAYLTYLDARRVTKRATDKVMAAWKATGIGAAYDWRKAVSTSPAFDAEHGRIADINSKMCAAYKTVSEAAYAINSAKPTYQQDVIALAATLAAALIAIEAANQEFIATQAVAA